MIFFIHIPKTAGTTFYEVVKKNHDQFLKPKVTPDFLIDVYRNSMNTRNSIAIRLPGGYVSAPQTLNVFKPIIKDNTDFIGGHVGYGFHKEVENDVNYISFIRNPKERLLSDYKEQCKPGRHLYDLLSLKDFDINYYLELVLADKLDNIMTRQIAGPYDFYLKDRTLVDETLYKTALDNCDNIIFFNLNNFDEAIAYMSKEFGWNNLKYELKNVGKNIKPQHTKVNDSLLNEVIHFDLKLFDKIKTVNENKMSSLEKLIFKIKSKAL